MLHLLLKKAFLLIIVFYAASKPMQAQSSLLINNLDSVVFDIEQSTISGGFVEFPVKFLSDDSIFALDFSFKYNQLNFLYDSTINITTGLTALAHYNPNDSIVRVTSYSLSTLPNDSPIVKLRFQVLSGTFCNADVNTVKGYLNGDLCSNKLVNCNTTGINETGFDKMIQVFPNPSSGVVHVNIPADGATLSITDLYGKIMLAETGASRQHTLNLSSLTAGLYFIIIQKDETTVVSKLILK